MAKGALSMLPTEGEGSSINALMETFLPKDEGKDWLAMAAGLGAPTKTGALGESLSNAASMRLDQRNQHDKLKAAYAPLISNIFETQAKAAQQAQLSAMLEQALGSGAQPMSPGAFETPAVDGVGPTMPDAMRPQAGSRLAGLSPDAVAMLKAKGIDLSDMYKWTRDPSKQEGGAFYTDRSTGQTIYRPKVPEGATMGADGTLSGIPGLESFLSKQTMATEMPKQAAAAAGRINLRKNADGTESPVTELSENPMLRDYLESQRGGVPNRPPITAAPRPGAVASVATPGARPANPMAAQPGDTDRAMILNTELDKANKAFSEATDPAVRQRALTDINALKAEMKAAGVKVELPSTVAGLGYGKTTAQEIADKTAETKAVKQVEADIQPTATRESAIAGGEYLQNLIGRTVNHKGRETATGLSGSLDPRNWVPGTNAKDFRVLLDQVKGSAFLQAFNSLKGGGAITEREGKAATDAIARLDTAQSDEAFKSALEDFQGVVKNALGRMKTMPAGLTLGKVEDGYRFTGGDPKDKNSWEKVK